VGAVWVIVGFAICCGVPLVVSALFTFGYMPWRDRRDRQRRHE